MKVGIIGGGAAGMMAALAAAESGAKVTILEGGERVGKKILSTGNGKCNLGNCVLSARDYNGADPEWTAECLRLFDTEKSLDFWKKMGLCVKNKNGYLYPLSEQASTVLDVLRCGLGCSGVEVLTEKKVTHIRPLPKGGFRVSAGKETFDFDRVILASGGKAAPKTGSDGSGYELAGELGHRIVPVVPALVQLVCEEANLKAVSGVRVEGTVQVYDKQNQPVCAERGEIQLTDYGISGIPVFQLSRRVNYLLRKQKNVRVVLDLLPDMDVLSLNELQNDRKNLYEGRTVEEFFTGILHKKLMLQFIKMAGLKPQDEISKKDREKIGQVYDYCKHWELHVSGSKSFDQAQVCAGGVDTAQVTTDMESKLIPGLYFAGELLDVDGRCGGYNLHWAWCSGYIAGCAAGKEKA